MKQSKLPKLNKDQQELLDTLASGATRAMKKTGVLKGKVSAKIVIQKPKLADLKTEILWLQTELEKWRKIAAWMGECHAANLHDAEKCSVSNYSKRRKR